MKQRFNVGDKVIPINKTIGHGYAKFDECPHVQQFLKGHVDYLTVVNVDYEIVNGEAVYVCSSKDMHGNFFKESDLKPYNGVLEEGKEL